MKNRRGFTLVELLVSFTLITIVSISLFKTVLSVQKKAQRDISYNQYISFVSTFNNAIETDFTEDSITEFSSCGLNCYDITYTTAGVKRITIDKTNKTISYGTIKEKLPNNYSFYDDIIITSERAEGTPGTTFNTIITVRIPIKSNLVDYTQDVKYVYQYYSLSDDVLNNIYCNLSVDPNGGIYGGSSGTTNYQLLPNGTEDIVSPTANDGYMFNGWTLTGGGSISNGVFTASSTVEDSVLTANWVAYSDMYTYTGSSIVINDGNDEWRIKFLTSGTFTPLINMTIDVFLVGGGGGGGIGAGSGVKNGGSGGGGGYTTTTTGYSLTANNSYTIFIGSGGTSYSGTCGTSNTGGTTTGFGYSAAGGIGGQGCLGNENNYPGGQGGSKGGTGGGYTGATIGYAYGIVGQSSTTCEFGQGTTSICDSGVSVYAGGGGGGAGNGGSGQAGGVGGGGHGWSGSTYGDPGTANTGGGGGGSGSSVAYAGGGTGGSGIVVIRNNR